MLKAIKKFLLVQKGQILPILMENRMDSSLVNFGVYSPYVKMKIHRHISRHAKKIVEVSPLDHCRIERSPSFFMLFFLVKLPL